MSTEYDTIYSLIRAAIQDFNVECPMYSDDIFRGQIDLTVLQLDDAAYEKTTDESFTKTLTGHQQLVLALEVAIRLLCPAPREFSYKNAIASVTRKGGGNAELIFRLEEMLADARGGRFVIAIDTDFDALIQSFDRYNKNVSDAYRSQNSNTVS